MNENKRKILLIVVTAIIILAAGFTILALLGIVEKPKFLTREIKVVDSRPTARNAYDIALIEARKWHSDALLSSINSGAAGETGHSDFWKLIFVSGKTAGKGFLVEVKDYKLVSASEITYSGSAADFPEKMMTPEQAILRVRSIKGYENVEVLGVEAIYGPVGKIWYWGVKTPKGVVSVEAR